jgi:hypothetical protein
VTAYAPAYRFTLYAPRSVDATEATVLTPASTTVHGDAFRVATLPDSTSGRGYLGLVRGRAGRLDPLTKAVDVGQLSFTILDKHSGLASDNLTRWMTWFVGDAFGVSRLVGLKGLVEESLNGGTTWAAYFTGRVSDVRLSGKLQYEVTLRDFTEDLLALPVFVGKPHASVCSTGVGSTGYAQTVSLLPVGLLYPYANCVATKPLTGVVTSVTTVTKNGVSYGLALITLDSASAARNDNVVTDALNVNIVGGGYQPGQVAHIKNKAVATKATARLRIKRIVTGAVGDLVPTDYGFATVVAPNGEEVRRITTISAHELPKESAASATPPFFIATPPVGTLVEVSVHVDAVIENANALALNDVHPVQLWADILDGKFGYLWQYGEPSSSGGGGTMGAPKRTVPYNSTAFSGLIADPTLPVARCSVHGKDAIGPWVQKNILQPYQLSYYLGGNGVVEPVDLRRPTALPAITIADADVVEGAAVAWEHSRDSAIGRAKVTYYQDNLVTGLRVAAPGERYATPKTNGLAINPLDEVPHDLVLVGLGRSDVSDKEFVVDARGMRGAVGEKIGKTDRMAFMAAWLEAAMHDVAQPFGSGAVTMDLPCRRTTNTDVRPGQVVLLDVTFIPDPATNLRGGTRLVRVLERRDEGLTRRLKLLDLGESVACLPPSLSLVTASSGNERNGAYITVTLNAAKTPAEIHRAATTIGATVPDSSAGSWVLAGLATTTMEIHAAPLPSGHRIWFRGRSLPGPTDVLKRPSSWVAASSNGYLDLAVLPAPSAVGTSSVDAYNATVLFTAGSSALATKVQLVTPGAGTLADVQLLGPGSERTRVTNLVAASSYLVSLTHEDGFGGASTAATAVFLTLSTAYALTATPLLGVSVLLGGTAG